MYRIPSLKLMIVREGATPAETRRISVSGDVHALMSGYYRGHDREEFAVLLLDANNSIVGIHTVSIGSLTMSIVHPREVFKAAIISNAAGIILSHNHPAGDPTPSREDRELTYRLAQAGTLLGIRVLDHIIVGNTTYYSFADSGTLGGA